MELAGRIGSPVRVAWERFGLMWVANEICPLTATDLPAVVTTGRG